MRLTAFRVQNYKNVDDTGWVSTGPLTVLVGKNEAGKSAICEAISMIRPSDDRRFDPLRHFPRHRYHSEFKSGHWPTSSGRFKLDPQELEELLRVCSELAGVEEVEVTSWYDGKVTVEYLPVGGASEVSPQELIEVLDRCQEQIAEMHAPEGRADQLALIKDLTGPALATVRQSAHEARTPILRQVQDAISVISSQITERWQAELFEPLLAQLRRLEARIQHAELLPRADSWVLEHLPSFYYFQHYDVIDSAIHIPTFLKQVQSGHMGPGVRTISCLFRLAGIDVQQLAELGRHQPGQELDPRVQRQIDERTVRADHASQLITDEFNKWWSQSELEFQFHFDGDYLRVWVREKANGPRIELDQRSSGLQYFFSFFVVFMAESKGQHANGILMLDEPGNNLHAAAQENIVALLDRLSTVNQVLYSTHSPFMIDGNHLERVRIAYRDETGKTRVSDRTWPKDPDALFPLQAALGYRVARSLFEAKRQVIVESLTDKWLLDAVNMVLAHKELPQLDPDVVVLPAGGIANLLQLANLLTAGGVKVAAILDGTGVADSEKSRIVGDFTSSVLVSEYTASGEGSMEDLLPEDVYLRAVAEAYQVYLEFTEEERRIPQVAARSAAAFERMHLGRFENWRVGGVLRDMILDDPDVLPESTVQRAAALVTRLNSVLA